jgi:CRP-like cAMP-binding protein
VLSFFTGAPHVSTAVATTDVTVWVLRRADLPELLASLPGLRAAVQRYLEQDDVQRYLREQQGAAPQQAELWVDAPCGRWRRRGPHRRSAPRRRSTPPRWRSGSG